MMSPSAQHPFEQLKEIIKDEKITDIGTRGVQDQMEDG